MKAESKLELLSERNKKFYVYLYRDPRPQSARAPIYVGKGRSANRRAHSHIRRTHNPFFANILAKIYAAGFEPEIEIVARFEDEQDAFDMEQKLIATYGRRDLGLGTLVNLSDGGDGPNGRIVSEIEKERTRQMGAAVWADEAARKKLIDALTAAAKKSWLEEREFRLSRIAAGNKERREDPARHGQFVAQRRAAATEQWSDPAHRADHSEKNRAANILAWSDPDHRVARVVAMKAGIQLAMLDPEKKQRRLAACRANAALGGIAGNAAWKDPIKKAARIAKAIATRKANARSKATRGAV
jgi:hypothetical protein